MRTRNESFLRECRSFLRTRAWLILPVVMVLFLGLIIMFAKPYLGRPGGEVGI